MPGARKRRRRRKRRWNAAKGAARRHCSRWRRPYACTATCCWRAPPGWQRRLVLGSWRAAQVRTTLRGMTAVERRQFLQQVAGRIFTGAGSVEGEVRNQDDLEQAPELIVTCRAPRFVRLGRSVDVEQLVP